MRYLNHRFILGTAALLMLGSRAEGEGGGGQQEKQCEYDIRYHTEERTILRPR